MGSREFDELGDKLQDIIDKAVNSKDFQKLNQNINQTVNKAVDTGSDALKRVLNSAFSGSGGEGTYENKTAAFEARQREERRQAELRRQEIQQRQGADKQLPQLYSKTTGVRVKGVMQAAAGGILTGTMGLGAIGFSVFLLSGVLESVASGLLAFSAAGTALGAWMLISGSRKIGRTNRFQKYIKTMGRHTYCNFRQLAEAVGKPVKYVVKDVREMIDNGWFLQGHVDQQETFLITSNETYRQYEETQKQLELRQKEEEQRAKELEELQRERGRLAPEVQEVLDRGNEYLEKIRRSNDAIPGHEVSAKISRMELIIQKIFERATEHPEIIPDLKRLMDYYLPMTVKLLDAYEDMDSQPVQGENIRNSKQEIENTLDTLNQAFEKLLDSIFQDTAWDVSSDISVLHAMLAQEGLTEDEFEKLKKTYQQ